MSKRRKPAFWLHKPTGQARVRIDGKDHYLGEYDSPESRELYDDLISEWFAKQGDLTQLTLTVADLCLLFIEFADEYYRHEDGTPTGSVSNIRCALRHMIAVHGSARVREFGPLKLKQVRQAMIDAGLCRTNINRLIHWCRRLFSWGVENEHVPVDVYTALCTVKSLAAGRTAAKESEPVQPVAEGVVNATLPHLPQIVADMVQLQLVTGARPGEICSLRPCEISFGTDGLWTYRPRQHKTAHRGKERRIHIGPIGQDILRPYMDRESEQFCFSPKESESHRNAQRRNARQTPMTPSQAARKPKGRRLKDKYTKDSYGRAVKRGCTAADVDAWSPNQLRHSRATAIREQYGIEAAMVVLGHSDANTSEIYAQRDFKVAARIMKEIG